MAKWLCFCGDEEICEPKESQKEVFLRNGSVLCGEEEFGEVEGNRKGAKRGFFERNGSDFYGEGAVLVVTEVS